MRTVDNNALIIAFLIGISIFIFIVLFAMIQYDNSNKNTRFGKEHPNEWLFSDFYLKVYSAFFGYENPDVVATRIGIHAEDYYKNCEVVKEKPNMKKLIVNTIYGFLILIITIILCIFGNILAMSVGGPLFIMLVFYEQNRLKNKAQARRLQVANELPRFLDLLKTELLVGLPIETAIYILCNKFDSLLSSEFLEALNKMELGASGWQAALEDVASKYEVETLSNFVLDTTTAYSKGVSVADSVARKTEDIKQTHLLNVKERAGKTTNTILIPVAVLQIIPLLIFLMYPAMTQVLVSM